MGTLKHIQTNMTGPFGLNLMIPPLPKFDPNGTPNQIGISSFLQENQNSASKISNGMDIMFTLPSDNKNANVTSVSNILNQEKSKSSQRLQKSRLQGSIFADGNILDELLKDETPREFDTSNLWEDYGKSKNDNRFKDLRIAPCGLVSKETCDEFRTKVDKFHETLFFEGYQEVADFNMIEAISMVLIGLNGEVFEYDENDMVFHVNKILVRLKDFTHATLFQNLEVFRKAGTQFYRVQRVIEYFKLQGKGTLVTNIFYELLQDYLTHYSSSVIQIKSESQGFLDFLIRCRRILDEMEVVYDITFCKAIREDVHTADLHRCIPKSGYLLNFNYNSLNSIELSSMHTDLIQHIFQNTVKPLLNYIRLLIFKGLLVDEYNEFFVSFDKNVKMFVLKRSIEQIDLPLFLKSNIMSVLECANNMFLFKSHDQIYYDVLKEEQFEIDVKFNNLEIKEYERQTRERFELKYKYLDQISLDLKILEEQKQYEQLQKKLRYMQRVKEEMEREAEKNRKLVEAQREQKENLRRALEEQMYNKKVLDKYAKQLEKEAEKAQMLEKELQLRKELENEKKRLLKELRNIQNNGNIPELEDKLSDQDNNEQIQMDMESFNENNLPSIQRSDHSNLDRVEMHDHFGTPRRSQIVEEGSIKTNENGTIRTEKRSRRKWKDGVNNELRFGDDNRSQGTLTNKESPPRIRGYMTPMKEENFVAIKGTNQVQSQIRKSKWLERRVDLNGNKEEEEFEEDDEDEMLNLVNERMPIDILVQICVANIIQEQTRLTNKAMVQILLDKHNLKNIVTYMKEHLFSSRGDKADAYIEQLFNETSDVNWHGVISCNSLWEENASFEKPPFNFYFEIKTKTTTFIPQTVENLDLSFYMDLCCKMPPILERMFTKDHLECYLKIFGFIVKQRYLSMIIRRKWKVIGKDLSRIREYRKFAKHAQLFRHKLQTFIDSYQKYIYISTIEGSWKKLCSKFNKAKSYDDLVHAHEMYLDSIIKKCFINTHIKKLSESIAKIVSIIINNLAYSEVNFIKLTEYTDELRTLEIYFDSEESYMSLVFDNFVKKDQQNQFVTRNE